MQAATGRRAGLRRWLRSQVSKAIESAKFLVILIALVGSTLAIFGKLLAVHWSFGFLLIAVYGYVVLQTIRDLKARRLNLRQGIGASIILVCLSAAIFATVSFMIVSVRPGAYVAASGVTFWQLLLYYAWVFLDLLPAIDAVKTLGIAAAPVEHKGVVAGLPVAAFKGFVVLVLLRVIKDLWTAKTPAEDRRADRPVSPN